MAAQKTPSASGIAFTPTGTVAATNVQDAIAEVASEASGGGFTPVGCVLARDADFDIRTAGNYDVLWDALYDNFWDLNPLAAIPSGLGLTFAFDGSASLIVPDEAGIWTFSYFAERDADNGWAGSLRVGGIAVNFPWMQQLTGQGPAVGRPFLAGTTATPLPAGTQMTHQVVTDSVAGSNPYTCTQVYLSIVRHA